MLKKCGDRFDYVVLEHSKSSSFIDDSVGRSTLLFDTAVTTQHSGYAMLAAEYLDAIPLVAVCTSMPNLLLTRPLWSPLLVWTLS